jgi:uncharacterized protein YjbJ (UPF0337 family)
VDLSKLTKADQILGGAGIVFILASFLTWFSIDLGTFGDVSANGWDVGFLWARLPVLIVFAMLVWVGLRKFSSVKLPTDIPALYLAGGALAFALPLLKLVIGEDGPISRGFGLFIAVIAGAGVAFGGFLKFTEGGGKLDELKSQLAGAADQLGDKAKSAVADAKDAADKKD